MRALLREPNFIRVWLVGLVGGIGRWLEMLALGIYAYEVTGSPFLVALLMILRMTPLALFGPIVGVLADRFDRKLLLGLSMALMTATSVVMGTLFWLGIANYWHVAVAAVVGGVVWTTDMPLRRRMIGDAAGERHLAQAMSLDSATNNATRMAGPLLGGVIYQFLGIIGVYALSASVFAFCVLLVLGLRLPASTEAGGEAKGEDGGGPIRDLLAAVRFARGDSHVLRILGVTLVFNLWGFPFTSMIPVIGRDDLALAPTWVGALSGLEGGGAFLGALVIAGVARPAQFARIYYFGTMVFLCFVFLVGWVPGALATATALMCVGLAGACFTTMQSTLTYLAAPARMRGRMFGLLVLCIGSGLIGFSNVGLMAEWFGAKTALRIIAVEGLIPLALLGIGWPALRRGYAKGRQ